MIVELRRVFHSHLKLQVVNMGFPFKIIPFSAESEKTQRYWHPKINSRLLLSQYFGPDMPVGLLSVDAGAGSRLPGPLSCVQFFVTTSKDQYSQGNDAWHSSWHFAAFTVKDVSVWILPSLTMRRMPISWQSLSHHLLPRTQPISVFRSSPRTA